MPLSRAKSDEIADRRHKVAELVLSGYSERAIARRLEVSNGTVHNDIVALRKEWAEERTAKWEEHVGLMMARLTQLERTLTRPIAEGDLAAVDRALKILDRRARLLGLDAPQAMTVGFDVDEARSKIRTYLDSLADDDHEPA